MNAIQRMEIAAQGPLKRPRLNGPGVKSLLPRNRAAMGMA